MDRVTVGLWVIGILAHGIYRGFQMRFDAGRGVIEGYRDYRRRVRRWQVIEFIERAKRAPDPRSRPRKGGCAPPAKLLRSPPR